MNENERHKLIVETLKGVQFATVKDLTEVLDVSEATIRRDILKLNNDGRVRKVFGGIAVGDKDRSGEGLAARRFEENRVINVERKRAIAAAANALCRDGDSIIVNGGTTCFMFARELASANLRIFTNSMPIAAHFWDAGTNHLTVSGGDLHREPGILHPTGSQRPTFFASKFFLGAQGIGSAGILESHPMLVDAVQWLTDQADEVVVLADSSKFSLQPRLVACPLARIGTLVTDDGISDDDFEMCVDAGIKVVRVPVEASE